MSPSLPLPLLLFILFAITTARAEEKKPPPLSEYYSTLARVNVLPPSGDEYDAFDALMRAKEPGWALLRELLLNPEREGDAARRIWNGPMQETPEFGPFSESFQKELDRRLENETWALQYAKADLESHRYARGCTRYEQIENEFDRVKNYAKDGFFGINILYLRIRLIEYPAFPGHRFPWNGTVREKKRGVEEMLNWWARHKKEVRAPDAEELDERARDALKPATAEIKGPVAPDSNFPWQVGNVEVVTRGGVREKWTSAGNCLKPLVDTTTGSVGWLLFSERNSRGEPLSSTLRVVSPDFGRRDFHAGPVIDLWIFSEDGATVVLKVLSPKTGLSFVQYDLRTRKQRAFVQGPVPFAQLPAWAQPLADDIPLNR
jgi:hypothetical protein